MRIAINKLKKVDLCGTQFRIPEHWIEEYETETRGVFYDDVEGSETFRLTVLTAESSLEGGPKTAESLLAIQAAQYNSQIISLPNNNALIAYEQDAMENSQRLHVYYWQVVNPLSENHARIAIFSFTILASRIKDSDILEQVKLLHKEIHKCSFSAVAPPSTSTSPRT